MDKQYKFRSGEQVTQSKINETRSYFSTSPDIRLGSDGAVWMPYEHPYSQKKRPIWTDLTVHIGRSILEEYGTIWLGSRRLATHTHLPFGRSLANWDVGRPVVNPDGTNISNNFMVCPKGSVGGGFISSYLHTFRAEFPIIQTRPIPGSNPADRWGTDSSWMRERFFPYREGVTVPMDIGTVTPWTNGISWRGDTILSNVTSGVITGLSDTRLGQTVYPQVLWGTWSNDCLFGDAMVRYERLPESPYKIQGSATLYNSIPAGQGSLTTSVSGLRDDPIGRTDSIVNGQGSPDMTPYYNYGYHVLFAMSVNVNAPVYSTTTGEQTGTVQTRVPAHTVRYDLTEIYNFFLNCLKLDDPQPGCKRDKWNESIPAWMTIGQDVTQDAVNDSYWESDVIDPIYDAFHWWARDCRNIPVNTLCVGTRYPAADPPDDRFPAHVGPNPITDQGGQPNSALWQNMAALGGWTEMDFRGPGDSNPGAVLDLKGGSWNFKSTQEINTAITPASVNETQVGQVRAGYVAYPGPTGLQWRCVLVTIPNQGY